MPNRCDAAANKSGKRMDLVKTMRASIEKAGFIDVHEKALKWPIGPWPRDKTKKELGSINLHHWLKIIIAFPQQIIHLPPA